MLEHAPANLELLLVGRQRELALLWSHFEAVVAGRLQVVLIAGEPGIGKTRLLEVIAARASQHDAVVLRGGASEAEGMPPYLPFLETLGHHIRTAPLDELREQAGTTASILASILPELTVRLGDLPAGYPLPPEQARLRLYEAVGTFLAAIAAPRPLLLILDDLQWADTASLDLLCHVARHQPSARLLILSAYREGEVEQNAAFQRAIAGLTRLRVLTTVSLGPLAASEVTALAANYLSAPVDPVTSQLLATQSEGNPFFAEELLRGWLETGTLVQIEGTHKEHRYWTLTVPDGQTLTPSIVSTVRQRLAYLTPQVIEYLRTAAIIGRTFDTALLAEVTGQEVEEIEEHLLEACRARLIRARQDDTYIFSHDLIRECLYSEVTPARRRRLHGFIGHTLETRSEQVSAQRLADLAFHFTRSGDRAQGVTYAQRAAEQAMSAYAFEEAMNHYRTALNLLDSADARRGELLICLGEAAVLASAEREAVAAFEAAQTWFQQVGDPMAAAGAAHRLGQAWWRLEAIPAARTAFETALALLEDRPCTELVQVLVDLGTLLAVNLHQQPEGIAYARRALELAQHLEDDRLVAAASRTVGNLLVRANDLPEGIGLLEQALALATAVDDPAEAAECCACLVMAYGWNSKPQRMCDIACNWMEFARHCHDPYQLRHVYSMLAVVYSTWGKWAEAEQMIAQAQSIVEQLASPEPLAFLYYVRGFMAYQLGDYATAEALLGKAMALFRAIGPGALVWYLGWLGLAQLVQGKVREARAHMAEVETFLATFPAGTMPTAEPLTQLVAMALNLRDWDRIERYYPQLVAFRGQCHDFLVDRLLGEIETLQGNWAAAEAHLAAAEATARREDIKPELARTLVAQADLELAQGGRGSAMRARNLLRQALDMMEQLGMAGEARHLHNRLGSLPEPSATAAQPTLPDDLTPREVEVLGLIAAGKSNQEIARELVLSVRTVERHISNIYTKIGAEGKVARATATAYALRYGLIQLPNT